MLVSFRMGVARGQAVQRAIVLGARVGLSTRAYKTGVKF